MKQKSEKRRGLSIKWSTFFFCISAMLIAVAFLWLFQIVFLDSFYHSIKKSQIQNAMQEIEQHISDEDLKDRLEKISDEKQLCIIISDEMGHQLYSNALWQNSFVNRLNEMKLVYIYSITLNNGGRYMEQFKNVNNDYTIFETDQSQDNHPETLLYTSIVTTENGERRMILLVSDLVPVTSTVETLRAELLWITFGMIILAFLLALCLSFIISRPIHKINSAAKQLAQGDYEPRFSESGYREIRELGQTLNYAAVELSKVERLQRELVANISHDLRTPLTMIIGYAEVMRDLPGENTPENVQVIIDEATRLSTLVNDVLDISKLQADAVEMNVEVFNLTESVRSMLMRYSKMSDYSITFDYDSDGWVEGDVLRISQVIYNLVNNAITYTGEDKRVMVTQSIQERRIRITVEDTGDGIDPELLNDIWERYYKVDKEHKRAQIGTGLGLSIVKAILDMHPNTTYGVKSQVGQGSQFWFEMDLQNPPKKETVQDPALPDAGQ